MDLVYLFDTDPRGVTGDVPRRLHEAVERW